MRTQSIDALTMIIGSVMTIAGPILDWQYRQYAATKRSFFAPASI